MSTKIWEAYRMTCPNSWLWAVVRNIRLTATKRLKKRLRKDYEHFMANVDTSKEPYKKLRRDGCSDRKARLEMTDKLLREGYKIASISRKREPFDYDLSITFRSSKGRVYLIPYGGIAKNELNFLKKHPHLEDYHYQNQTDQPSHISAQAWEGRRRTWDTLLEDDCWRDMLILEICRWDMFYMVSPCLDIVREIYREESRGKKAKARKKR